MRASFVVLTVCCFAFLATASPEAPRQQPPQERSVPQVILSSVADHQYNLETSGKEFFLNEARANHFFLLGELHGDNEIPTLLRELWPAMWRLGYRHIAAEVSPWAAHQLQSLCTGPPCEIRALGLLLVAFFAAAEGKFLR